VTAQAQERRAAASHADFGRPAAGARSPQEHVILRRRYMKAVAPEVGVLFDQLRRSPLRRQLGLELAHVLASCHQLAVLGRRETRFETPVDAIDRMSELDLVE
jgi:hypothetical protein